MMSTEEQMQRIDKRAATLLASGYGVDFGPTRGEYLVRKPSGTEYTVTMAPDGTAGTCDCPGRLRPCKHVKAVIAILAAIPPMRSHLVPAPVPVPAPAAAPARGWGSVEEYRRQRAADFG